MGAAAADRGCSVAMGAADFRRGLEMALAHLAEGVAAASSSDTATAHSGSATEGLLERREGPPGYQGISCHGAAIA
jgi:hypothetical protein